MPIVLGNDTITGLGVGGLPNGTVNADDLASGAVTRAKMGYAGAVLQVVTFTQTAAVVESRGGWSGPADWSEFGATMGVTITPTSASSKILFMVSMGALSQSTNAILFRMLRGGTVIGVADASSNRPQASFRAFREGDSNHTKTAPTMIFLDSPNTTSSTSYRLQWSGEGGPTIYINRAQSDTDNQSYGARTITTFTAMEIAG
jgi:hypothetical protein